MREWLNNVFGLVLLFAIFAFGVWYGATYMPERETWYIMKTPYVAAGIDV